MNNKNSLYTSNIENHICVKPYNERIIVLLQDNNCIMHYNYNMCMNLSLIIYYCFVIGLFCTTVCVAVCGQVTGNRESHTVPFRRHVYYAILFY